MLRVGVLVGCFWVSVAYAAGPRFLLREKNERVGQIKADVESMRGFYSGRVASSKEYLRVALWAAEGLRRAGAIPWQMNATNDPFNFLQTFQMDVDNGTSRMGHRLEMLDNVAGLHLSRSGRKETIVAIAHLDGALYMSDNANDNASGVLGVLNLARNIGEFRRWNGRWGNLNVLYLIPTAEERGLVGTIGFTRLANLGDLRIVGALNLEMIGRGEVNKAWLYGGYTHDDSAQNWLFRYAMDQTNNESSVQLTSGADNPRRDYVWGRSDHMVFANCGVASLMYFGGMVDYHSEQDTFDRLDLDRIDEISNHATGVVGGVLSKAEIPASSGLQLPKRDIARTSHLFMRELYAVPRERSAERLNR